MSYTQKELDRLVALHNSVENCKKHEYAAPTYKDSPYLTEMAEIVMSHSETDVETLEESIPVLYYLVDCYDAMCRAGISVKYYSMLLTAYVQIIKQKKLENRAMEDFENCFYLAVRARNYYEPDDCRDLVEIVTESLQDEKIKKLFESAMRDRSAIKYDPVEKTEKYLAVIDEVERKINKNKTMDFCLEYWNLKKDYLKEYGICWRSPSELNPGVMFD